MKKRLNVFLVFLVILGVILTACTSTATSTSAAETNGNEPEQDEQKVAVLLVPIYQEYFKIVADTAAVPLEELGYDVEILSAEEDAQTMINQIQNSIVKGVDIMYIFPAGDASAFHDVVKEAHDAGIKVVVSHNDTGEGTADSIILADEYIMGTMGAKMVSEWVDQTYPDAEPGSVKVLVLESAIIPDMIKRSAGIKLVAEKFLRKVDMTNATYIKTDSPDEVYYLSDGQQVEVDEPTGGLILDENGNAILNPFYNEKVVLVTSSDRMIMQNTQAQNAMDAVFAANDGANRDIVAVACYAGDACIGASEKMISMYEQGVITTDLSMIGTFGADDTQTNIDYILNAEDSNVSVLRGVMTAGDILGTIAKTLEMIANGEDVPAYQYEPLGYMIANDDYTDVIRIMYDNELPSTSDFFE